MKIYILALLFLLQFLIPISAQIIPWSGFPNGGTSYISGIMTATITSNSPGFQNNTPRHYANATVGSGECGIAGGLALEHRFGNITTAFSQVNLDFTSGGTSNGLCGNISFQIRDINSDESTQTFSDWVEISAIDGNDNPVPLANITATGGSNKTFLSNGNTRIVVGRSNASYGNRASTACDLVSFSVTPPAGTTLKMVYIKYRPDYTVAPNDYYSLLNPKRPGYQYISISPITVNATNAPTAIQFSIQDAGCNANDGHVTITGATGGVSPYVFNFNNLGNGTTTFFDNLSAGSYPLSVTDQAGCTFSTTATVGQITGPTAIQVQANPSTCGQANGSANVSGTTGGTAPYLYNWENSGFSNVTSFSNLSAGTYSLEVRDINNCIHTQNVVINDLPGPTDLSVNSTAVDCGQTNGTITITSTLGGNAPYTYSIDGINFQSTTTFSNLSAGTYTVQVLDANNCSYSETIAVPSSANGPSSFTAITVSAHCQQAIGSIEISAVNGGQAPYQYRLNNGNFGNSNLFSNLSPGTYSVSVKDVNGCLHTQTVTVENISGPTSYQSTITPEACEQDNGSITIEQVNGGISPYQFSINGSSPSTVNSWSDLSSGTYQIAVIDNFGCIYSSNLEVSELTGPTVIQTTISNVTCGGTNGVISVSNVIGGVSPLVYSIDGGTFSNENTFSGLGAGTYTISVTDGNGCSFSSPFIVGGSPAGPTSLLYFLEDVECGDTEVLFYNFGVLGGTSPFEFEMDGQAFLTDFMLPIGTHTLVVTDANGCSQDTVFTVMPPPTNDEIFIPNVFSPNGDVANPVWFVEGTCVKTLNGVIVNRWGQEMKTLVDLSTEWNGLWYGEPVSEGVYFYKIDVTFYSGVSKTYHGHVTVKY